MIPDEAVEAALRVLPDGAGVYVNRDDLRAILEAAAPYIAAQAWDEAIEAYKAWTWDDENIDPLANPYRETTHGDD